MAAELGLSTDGTHEKLVTRVVKHRNALDSSRLLTDGTTEGVAAGGGASGGGGGRKGRRNEPLTRDSLPENLENASEDMLRAVRIPASCCVQEIATACRNTVWLHIRSSH